MEIISAEFVISNSDYTKCPNSQLPEYAFIGRSNVGKSSLINMLTNKKNLAKTSSKPGKTLLINHFLINQTWHLVDLPGYGYASIGKDMRQKLKEIIEGYLLYRPQLTNVFLLIDSRHAPQKIDMDFMQWMGENEIPFAIVFTKIDKLSQTKSKDNIEKYKDSLAEVWETLPKIFVTSSEKQQGREELLDYIDEINRSL
ncbi:MAG: YihA family ribosome biogenesis GTP-binding protein [Paludibacteraceae bacterium]|jgi:GTP-binding protein|nr:YihA family ribosome biogenesis GTP-binding protein [Paludibacteraceae bacterium]MDI9537097.1 ribosome biogenesis GTP-binding protein YihA/YsxC [Bacteroidota bacterium]OQC34785.1 MAG: putative GTP-binding protein EngB [Bacteroidetes bacterium ADurb.Bin057]HHT61869.1 YihA family ribosome biogenesis GTP-binding protein [Bacteroidales bacterium]MBP9039657.1 YihA family ribosome biogenesis GTP-binding protein [Paludibacteraceae bacterium]